jgi:hypothetical protein
MVIEERDSFQPLVQINKKSQSPRGIPKQMQPKVQNE